MENKNESTAKRLLMMTPEDELEDQDNESPEYHQQENIIPPVGIAKPELVQSFMENIQNPEGEENIKKEIQDIEEYHRESTPETVAREVKSYGLRALEGLGGTIGAFMNALSGEAHFDDNGELLKTEVPKFPSTSELREFTKKQTGKKYEPKTPFGKEAHEAATDIGTNAPIPGAWMQKILTPIFGQSVKAFAKNQGATENEADMYKLGTMMMTTVASLGNAPAMARQAYTQAANMIPQGTRMATRGLQTAINNLRNQPWYRTGRNATKGPAFDELTRIEGAIQHGSMDVHDAMQIRRDINNARKRLGAFNYEPGIDKAQARRHLDQVDDALREGMEHYGNTSNPEWLRNYERANQAYAVTQRSRQLQDYIQSSAIGNAVKSNTAKTLFHLGGASALTQAPALLAGAIPVAAGAKGLQIINRMIRSPVLRNHYIEVLTQAAAQNAGAMNRALERFDKEALKFEKNQ